jgi:hypothetical protein
MFPINTILAWEITFIINMEYDNNHFIIASRAYSLHTAPYLSCFHTPWVRHAFPMWNEWGLSCKRFEYAYLLEKIIELLTETMPNHGRSFSMDFLITLNKFNLVLSWYFKRSSFVYGPIVPVYIAFAIQKALCTGGMEVPLCKHLVKIVCT